MAEIAVSLESVTIVQEKFNNSNQISGTTIFGRMVYMFAFPSKQGEKSGVPSSSSRPSADELWTCIAESQAPTNRLLISGDPSTSHPSAEEVETCVTESQAPTNSLHISSYENENDSDIEKSLPTIEGLQILGDAFLGHEIIATGYAINGTTHCGFEWVRRLQDGSQKYLESATQPNYTVSADDIDTYLFVEVMPLDDNQRQGKLVQCVANDGKKITCHPNMIREIQNILHVGHSVFQLLVWISSSETWEPALLEIKNNSYNINLDGPNNSVVVNNKYTQNTLISLTEEILSEFSIFSPGGVELFLRPMSTDISYSRDTLVLTMRLFVKRAVDRKLGKKKALFF